MAQDHSQEAPGGFSPALTLGAGLLLSAGFGLLVGAEAHGIFQSYSDDMGGPFASVAFWGPAVIAAEEAFRNGYTHTIPTGWRGVPTVLNQRIPGFLLSEGTHWLPPFIMGSIMVDCREQMARHCHIPEGEDAIAADGIEMSAEFYWAYQIFDPYLYESKEHPLQILDSVGLGSVRNAIAGDESGILTQKETRSQISAQLLAGMQAAGESLGIHVTRAGVTKILPPQSIINANAKKAEEVAKRAAEEIRFANVTDRITQLKVLGFKPNEAYAIHAAESGSIPTTKTIHEVNVPEAVIEPITEAVTDMIGRIFPRRA